MAKAEDEISELMALQRAAAKRPRPKKSSSRKKSEAPESSEEVNETASKDDTSAETSTAQPKTVLNEQMQEFTERIEDAMAEIEEAAKDQPTLVSLVAFTLGLVIGQSFSRR